MELACELAARGLPEDGAHDAGEMREHPLWRTARQWRLLLQIDSDPDLGVSWGDGGRLYFWIREGRARAGDFSKVRLTMQGY